MANPFRETLSGLFCSVLYGPICLALLASSSAGAHDDIPALLQALSVPSRQVRLEAESQLRQQGEEALVAIEAARDVEGAPLAILDRLSQEIVAVAAQRAQRGTIVRLGETSEETTLQQAVDRLKSQSGYAVELVAPEQDRRRNISVPAKPLLFWEAVNQLCRRADLGWEWRPVRSLELSTSLLRERGAVAVDGAFTLEATIDPPKESATDEELPALVRVRLRIDAEPGVLPYDVTVHDADLSLLARGDGLAPFSPKARRELLFEAQWAEIPVDFYAPAPPDPGTLDLNGVVHVRCAARREQLHLSLREKESTAAAAEIRLWLEEVESSPDETTVVLRIRAPRGWPTDSFRLGSLHRDAWLMREDGTRLEPSAVELLQVLDHVHRVQYRFADKGDADSLEFCYMAPALVTMQSLTFDLRGIPLH